MAKQSQHFLCYGLPNLQNMKCTLRVFYFCVCVDDFVAIVVNDDDVCMVLMIVLPLHHVIPVFTLEFDCVCSVTDVKGCWQFVCFEERVCNFSERRGLVVSI